MQTLALSVGAHDSHGQTRYREERQGVSASFQTKGMLQRPRGGREMTEERQVGKGLPVSRVGGDGSLRVPGFYLP